MLAFLFFIIYMLNQCLSLTGTCEFCTRVPWSPKEVWGMVERAQPTAKVRQICSGDWWTLGHGEVYVSTVQGDFAIRRTSYFISYLPRSHSAEAIEGFIFGVFVTDN